jgi:N-acyl-D-glutamate deacylase
MTILPARMLGDISSDMARRGRIQSGAVADITVFDPTTIIDRSTIADPAREAEGVRHVLVSGRTVRTDGVNNQDVRPGVPILRDLT